MMACVKIFSLEMCGISMKSLGLYGTYRFIFISINSDVIKSVFQGHKP